MATRVSQNGFTVRTSAQVEPLSWITGRVDPKFHDLFDRFCKRFDREVEKIIRAHSWGWADRPIRGSSVVSNHASGTAIDLNAPEHPMGKSGTFTTKQVKALRSILKDFPEIRWGGDYAGRKDEMHFEIRKGVTTVAVSKMISPYEGRYVSAYDPNRYITYNGKRIFSPHRGADIAPPVPGAAGETVRASFAGTVRKAVSWATAGNTSSTWAPGRTGNGVLVSNPDGEGQGYNHVKPAVKVGQKVKAGDIIGHTDTSGIQTGPHLHFETWSDWKNPNSAFNPAILFKKYGVAIGSKPAIAAGSPPSNSNKNPPKHKKEWSDMATEKEIEDAAERGTWRALNRQVAIGGATRKRYGKKTAPLYSLIRDGGYALDEARDTPRRVWQYELTVGGATKTALGKDKITAIQALRYAAGVLFDSRPRFSSILNRLKG